MSMLSAQIDRLRELASEADIYGGTRHFRDPLSDAADTIWQLRDDLQRANDAVQDAEHDGSMAWDRVRKAEAENAKLRELVADVHESLKADKAGMFHNLTLSAMEDDMRELGIEVDKWMSTTV